MSGDKPTKQHAEVPNANQQNINKWGATGESMNMQRAFAMGIAFAGMGHLILPASAGVKLKRSLVYGALGAGMTYFTETWKPSRWLVDTLRIEHVYLGAGGAGAGILLARQLGLEDYWQLILAVPGAGLGVALDLTETLKI